MNYWKAALAGFGMSFIGTALCGSKTGSAESARYRLKIQENIYHKLFNIKNENEATYDVDFFKKLTTRYNLFKRSSDKLNFANFKYDEYYNEYLKQNEPNFWFNKDGWSVATAFLVNNLWCIPTSLLGCLFHDKVGRDLTPKINEYCGSEISPYLVTGGLFGGISTGFMINISTAIDKTKPWIYSISLIQGFLVGATAMAGAYFGDEKSEEVMTQEVFSQGVDPNIL